MSEVAEEVPEPAVSLPEDMSLPEITFDEDSSDDWVTTVVESLDSSDDWAKSILESLEQNSLGVDFVWLVGCVRTIFTTGVFGFRFAFQV